jgi:hypothetical protein
MRALQISAYGDPLNVLELVERVVRCPFSANLGTQPIRDLLVVSIDINNLRFAA